VIVEKTIPVPIRTESLQARRRCGQPYGLKFFCLRGGLRPVLHEAYLRVLTCQKVVLAILPMLALKKGCAWVRVAPVPASPLLTGCGRSDNPAFAGTGRGTGFPVRTRNWIKGREPIGHGFTGWLCTSGEAERKRLGEGERGAGDGPPSGSTARAENFAVEKV
jgi:hypothetical protein